MYRDVIHILLRTFSENDQIIFKYFENISKYDATYIRTQALKK